MVDSTSLRLPCHWTGHFEVEWVKDDDLRTKKISIMRVGKVRRDESKLIFLSFDLYVSPSHLPQVTW